MSTPKAIQDLVARFAENRDVYCSSEYNETQLRREFLDPFFKALGWDIDNEQGYAEAYKDVIHEDSIKVGRATKAPDYSFRIGGVRKFFVEAKRPSVGIKNDPEPAYQLRRYAWSAKLPLSILTDFEEFAVYDCRIKPNQNDKASVARVLYIRFDEFETRWDEIASIFSREAILKGSFDKYVESTKRKRGTAEVDAAFLKEIEGWRDLLARNIALRNTDLSNREVNFAVQRTIDRIIFLRICEDRGIEQYGQQMALRNGENVYGRLCETFRRADERYNSGLFHFRAEKDRSGNPDDLTLGLTIDDKILKGIFKSLYYPESPYEFSVLSANILGHIYEQFLGKVIRLTAGHRAVVEDKPEVKKAGGVYYTPTYIVDYIVEHTVGKLLEGKTPKQVSKLYVLDPACGSGSFLLGAYQTLLDWHMKWYSKHDPEKHAKGRSPKLYQGPGGDWRLTTTEKKRILLNNIYGVDIDPQAVEVTKLSLLLKVLEGENDETLVKHLRLFHERALPDLADNIKCGNSLIGPDFYEGQQLSLMDEEERYRINAFDWESEFPEIMGAGGFDAVIGNPPWVFTREVDFAVEMKRYIQDAYLGSLEGFQMGRAKQSGKINLFAIFILQSLRLLRREGLLGYIVPNTLLRATVYDIVRRYILDTARIINIVDLGPQVFERVTASTIVAVLEKAQAESDHLVQVIEGLEPTCIGPTKYVSQEGFFNNTSFVFSIHASELTSSLWTKIDGSCLHLGNISIIHAGGIATGPGKHRYIADRKISDIYKPLLEGKDVRRYHITFKERFILYEREKLYRARDERIFLADEKLVTRRIGGGNNALLVAYDNQQYYTFNSTNTILSQPDAQWSLKYILGLLNSRLLNWYYIARYTNRSTLTVNVSKTFLQELPVPRIVFSNPTDQARHDRMVELVDTMLKLHKNLQSVKTDHDKKLIQRQIDSTDKQIDRLVYDLYGLTDKEIRIVEEGTGKS